MSEQQQKNFSIFIQTASFICLLITIGTVLFNTGKVAKTIEYHTQNIATLMQNQDKIVERQDNTEKDITVLKIDVDNLKKINIK